MIRNTSGEKTYYEVLKICPDSNDEQVRQAYLRLARIYHPDKNPGNKRIADLRFRLLNEAYNALKTENSRARYQRIIQKQTTADRIKMITPHNDNTILRKPNTFWDNFFGLLKPKQPEDS